MKTGKKKSENFDLRKRAEDKIKTTKNKQKKGNNIEVEHELNVHKIELQMQNEELNSIQQDLIRSLENYADIFENAPFVYFILNKKGVILNVNQIGIDQLGLASKERAIGKHLSVFLSSAEDQDGFYMHLNRVLETQKSQNIECDIKGKSGKTFNVFIETKAVNDKDNTFKHFLCAVHDITRLKAQGRKLELSLIKEKELNELKSQFITIASHEFRTPLTAILSSTELIDRYHDIQDADKRKKHLRKITTAVSRLREILIDFVSVEKIAQGKTKNNPDYFNISDFMKSTLEEVRSFNGIHVVHYAHVGKNEVVLLDQKILKTCMINLLINAYKYSPKGGKIEVKTVRKKDELSIVITDQGIGIPTKDQSHIFEAFFRAKNVSDFQGTGLGLNITKESVHLMGGSISFTSRENEGTSFKIIFQQK